MNVNMLEIRTNRNLRFHRSALWTEYVAQVPALSGILLLNCQEELRPNWQDFREEAFRRCNGQPPWFCVWPNTGIAAFALASSPTITVRFQGAKVWVDPLGQLEQGFDFGWRSELGFDKGLGDRRLPGRHPVDLAGTKVQPKSCHLHGDGEAAAHYTFRRCHQLWLVPDWSGREVSLIGCEYVLGLEAPCCPSIKKRPALKIRTVARPGLQPTLC